VLKWFGPWPWSRKTRADQTAACHSPSSRLWCVRSFWLLANRPFKKKAAPTLYKIAHFGGAEARHLRYCGNETHRAWPEHPLKRLRFLSASRACCLSRPLEAAVPDQCWRYRGSVPVLPSSSCRTSLCRAGLALHERRRDSAAFLLVLVLLRLLLFLAAAHLAFRHGALRAP